MAKEASPTLHKGMQGDYVPVHWAGENTSGLLVYGKNVLVACDRFSQVTAGGVWTPDEHTDKMTAAAETGCIFAIGPEAFRMFDDGTRWSGDCPKQGDRIYFEKYAGQLAMGVDGMVYRVMDYRAIAAGYDLEYLAKIEVETPGEEAA